MYESYDQHASDFLSVLTPFDEPIPLRDPAPEIAPGTICTVAGREFIVLASYENGTSALLSRYLLPRKRFGDTADWRNSSLREELNLDYVHEIADDIGMDNIVPFRRSLVTLDGMQVYTPSEDRVSLLSFDDYRAFHDILRRFPVDSWWWTLTPWSGEDGWSRSVCCVYSGGYVTYDDCGDSGGVRPFLQIQSSVLSS